MFFENVKRAVTDGLSRRISEQVKKHKRRDYYLYYDVLCDFGKDYKGYYFTACIKSKDPYVGGVSISGQDWIYRCYTNSLSSAMSQLTSEVAEASIRHQQFNFFRRFRFTKQNGEFYLTQYPKLDPLEKEEWLNGACNKKPREIDIFEIYTGGSWSSSDVEPWSDTV